MRKFFIGFLSALFVLAIATQGWAEYSKTSVTGKKWDDNNVYANVYFNPPNANTPKLTKNYVCILDISGTDVATTTTLGAYVTTTTTTQSYLTFGVADEDIATNSVGKVCVRGVHLVQISGTIGTNMPVGTSATSGVAAQYLGASNTTRSYLGVVLNNNSDGSGNYWTLICPTIEKIPAPNGE